MPGHAISRRSALVAGLGAVAAGAVGAGGYGLVEAGALPGKYQLARLLGRCGSAPPPPRGPRPVRHETQFWSACRQRQVSMVTLIPAGVTAPDGLGVVVVLHGLGGDAAGIASSAALAMAAAGSGSPGGGRLAVVTVDGGATYWHRRASGDDPQGMIINEVLPRVARLGPRTGQIGIVGESMGGYGAVLLAERLGGGSEASGAARQVRGGRPARSGGTPAASGTVGGPRAAAVAAISPAIFASYADARQADRRAFDSQEDFAAHDVLTQAGRLRGIPAYVACGNADPFEPAAELLRARLRQLTGTIPAGAIEAGCHDSAFWARHLPAALTFLAGQLPGGSSA